MDKKRLSYTLIWTGLILIFMQPFAVLIHDYVPFNLFRLMMVFFTESMHIWTAIQIVLGIVLVVIGNKMKI